MWRGSVADCSTQWERWGGGVNTASHRGRRTYRVRTAGQVVEVASAFDGQACSGGGRRGVVECFSPASRRRLFRAMASISWEPLGPAQFITLTYPAEFPTDGRTVKAHMHALRKRWARRWGSNPTGAWKLEFQARGAPHIHLALVAPASPVIVRQWLSSAWFEIVASGDLRHLEAGVQVDELRDHPAAYFAGYVGGSRGSKEYQHTVPDGFENVGRFWGFWNLSPTWEEHELDRRDFVKLRRLCAAYRRSLAKPGTSARKQTAPERSHSLWVVIRSNSAAVFLARAIRALDLDARSQGPPELPRTNGAHTPTTVPETTLARR